MSNVFEGAIYMNINKRVWFFRIAILVLIGLLLTSWFLPWWTCEIEMLKCNIWIHPWGLSHNLGVFAGYAHGADMPIWFAPIMWAYLSICVIALIASLFIKDKIIKLGKFSFKLPSLIIGLVGFSYIVVVVAAVIMAAIRTGDFYNTHLIGYTYVVLSEDTHMESAAYTSLLTGYWLACAVGPSLLILSLLREKIIGNK